MQDASVEMIDDNTDDNFRPEFKRYKRKQPPASLEDVADVYASKLCGIVQQLHPSGDQCIQLASEFAAKLGLKPPHTWQCYEAQGYPGFQYIQNPFLPGYQRYWVKRCIADYPCKPNVTNMDAHAHQSSLSNPWRSSRQMFCKNGSVHKGRTPLDQLRWVTLGYHYDWNDRIYHQDHHSPFPRDLSLISSLIAAVLGYEQFHPQAAIVNFYHMDSTLGGHTDHSEFDLTAPLISFSLGQSAILLMGGQTKAIKPFALHLHSGDVVILGGASRLAYHAVPKVMHANDDCSLPKCLNMPHCQKPVEDGAGEEMSMQSNFKPRDSAVGEAKEGRITAVDATTSGLRMDTGIPCSGMGKNSDANAQMLGGEPPGSHSSRREQFGSVLVSSMVHRVLDENATKGCREEDGMPSNGDLESEVWGIVEDLPSVMQELSEADQWDPFECYLRNARINVSVRQVTGPGKGFSSRGNEDDSLTGDVKRMKLKSECS